MVVFHLCLLFFGGLDTHIQKTTKQAAAGVCRFDPICLVRTPKPSPNVPIYVIATDAEKLGVPCMHSDGIHVCVHVPKNRVFVCVKADDDADEGDDVTPCANPETACASELAASGVLLSEPANDTAADEGTTGSLA